MKCLSERVNSKTLERLRILRLTERIESRIVKMFRLQPNDPYIQRLWDDYEELSNRIESVLSNQQEQEIIWAAQIKARAADAVTEELVSEGPR